MDRGASYFALDFAYHARTFEVYIQSPNHISHYERLEQSVDVIYPRDRCDIMQRQDELREVLRMGSILCGRSRIGEGVRG